MVRPREATMVQPRLLSSQTFSSVTIGNSGPNRLFSGAGSFLAFAGGHSKAYASELGLEEESFNQCLDS